MGALWSVREGADPASASKARIDSERSAERSVVSRSYATRDFWFRRLLALADSVGVLLALVVAGMVRSRGEVDEFLLWGLLTIPAWLVLFKLYGLYDRDGKRVSHTTIDDVPWLFHALLVGSLLLWGYYKLAPVHQLILEEVGAFGLAAAVCVLGLRSLIRHLTPKLLGAERVLLVGDRETINLVSKLRAHPEYGLEPVGILSQKDAPPEVPLLPILGRADAVDLEGLADSHRIDRIVLSHTELDETAMIELLRECRELGLKVSVLPQLFDVMGPSVEVDDVEGVTVLGLNPPILPRSSRFLKRVLDVVLSGVALVVLAPVMALVAIAIKLDSRGPVFFSQQRVGKGGRRFRLFKFRTMVRDADRLRNELHALSQDPDWLKLEDDPRITRVGRFLRLSSLDELPELWNVLKGEMSIVGPRPLIESEDRQVDGWGRRRLDLTPGVTGLWQVLGRTDIPFAEMIKLDYLYVTNWSLWGDVRLLVRTLPAVLTRRGAN